jgi:hypothetical protein
MSNPFKDAEAWDVNDSTILGEGDYVLNVDSIDGTGNSSGGYPQIEIQMSNSAGSLRDWIVVTQSSIGRVVAFTDAVGLPRPTDEQIQDTGDGFRLAKAYLDQALSKKVGVVARDEPDYKDPSKRRTRIAGYRKPGGITPGAPNNSDFPAAASGTGSIPGTTPGQGAASPF